jgi:aryl-alcohol dehydrogenase-like predicted oxidoreductase
MLPKRRLGKTGFDVSVLGFGAAPAAFLKADQPAARDLIFSLLDEGLNLIDTATAYPGGHGFIGEHLSSRREDFVLVSKVGTPGDAGKFEPDRLKKQVDAALQGCKTDRIDVMLLHSCPLETLEADDALGALVECRDEGKILHCGYSGDNEAAAFACRLPDIAAVECSVNVVDQANIDGVLPLAHKHDVGVIAKRPIANAAWRDLDDQRGLYKTYAKTYTERLAKTGLNADDFGLDWPELALRFTLAQPGLTTAIVGTTNPDNAKKNLHYARAGDLPGEQVDQIRQAFKRVADGWDGQT